MPFNLKNEIDNFILKKINSLLHFVPNFAAAASSIFFFFLAIRIEFVLQLWQTSRHMATVYPNGVMNSNF